MDRLFLDANVLFSAAYRESAGIHAIWTIDNVVLSSSEYAVQEAQRNLSTTAQRERLQRFVSPLELVASGTVPHSLRESIQLPEKDWPILGGAFAARATHLITGDVRHFGRYFHERLGGILILPPADYLRDAHRGL